MESSCAVISPGVGTAINNVLSSRTYPGVEKEKKPS